MRTRNKHVVKMDKGKRGGGLIHLNLEAKMLKKNSYHERDVMGS